MTLERHNMCWGVLCCNVFSSVQQLPNDRAWHNKEANLYRALPHRTVWRLAGFCLESRTFIIVVAKLRIRFFPFHKNFRESSLHVYILQYLKFMLFIPLFILTTQLRYFRLNLRALLSFTDSNVAIQIPEKKTKASSVHAVLLTLIHSKVAP